MAEQQDLDRNEAATPYKLEKARERGQTARSVDVVSAVVFTAAVAFTASQGLDLLRDQFIFDRALLIQAGRMEPSAAVFWKLIESSLFSAALLLAPFFATLMLSGVIASVAQTGPVLSGEPLKLDFSRLNPVTGLKRSFSTRTLFDAFRASVKLVLLVTMAVLALRELLPHFYQLAGLPANTLLKALVDDAVSLGFRMALILGLIAILDLGYTRYEFAKKMRMSRRELKDEHKNREGDPRIRQRLRELRREALKRSQSVRGTRDADVVLANPTHIAVALQYAQGEMHAPKVVAKGAGLLAAAMRKEAGIHGIPVVENKRLARQLFRELDVNHHVPPELYADVARIIVWVFAMRKARQGMGAAA